VQILDSSKEYILIPLPSMPAPTLADCDYLGIALIPAAAGGEPGDDAYQAATVIDGEVAYRRTPGDYPPGDYFAFVRVQYGLEDVRLPSGRVRIGDART
jgi:hypothetical protein